MVGGGSTHYKLYLRSQGLVLTLRFTCGPELDKNMDNLFRKHEFSNREIVGLFTILDEDRNSFLDENEIFQWAEDIGLKWSRVEVTSALHR